MSGHSKWNSIKRQKEKNDQAKGKVFSRHAREIMVAARDGGSNVELNPRLRICVQRAKGDGMPSDNIDRAIKKGTGELEGEKYEEITYEGYGPHGVALLIDVMTDNRNRSVGEIRAAFNKLGGSLGESGCVRHQFTLTGVITLDAAGLDEDQVLEIAIEAGADDMRNNGDSFEILTAPEALTSVVKAVEAAGLKLSDFEVTQVPQITVKLDEHSARQVLRVVDALDDLEDVQKVHANFDLDEDVLAALSAD